jgi:hypothetical protein
MPTASGHRPDAEQIRRDRHSDIDVRGRAPGAAQPGGRSHQSHFARRLRVDQPAGHLADTEHFERALGRAVLASWGELSREVQETLFERAVVAGHETERDESLREQLAILLHHMHPRTG